jgi:hypothetical protein
MSQREMSYAFWLVVSVGLLVTGDVSYANEAVQSSLTEFPLPTCNRGPAIIAAGPDENLWFTEATANQMGRITTDGVIREFRIPYCQQHAPQHHGSRFARRRASFAWSLESPASLAASDLRALPPNVQNPVRRPRRHWNLLQQLPSAEHRPEIFSGALRCDPRGICLLDGTHDVPRRAPAPALAGQAV